MTIWVLNEIDTPEASVATDPHLLLTMNWQDLDAHGLSMLVKDPSQGYVELMVDDRTGALVQMVVVEPPASRGRSIPPIFSSGHSRTVGLDVELWEWKVTPDYREPKRRWVDKSQGMELTISGQQVAIWFSKLEPARWVVSGPAAAGVSADGALVVLVGTVPVLPTELRAPNGVTQLQPNREDFL